eukprot:458845-Prymnesium_polylepis.1
MTTAASARCQASKVRPIAAARAQGRRRCARDGPITPLFRCCPLSARPRLRPAPPRPQCERAYD